jgi:hypothetical protein
MARIIVTPDPSERRGAPGNRARMPGAQLLTQRQIRCMERLPVGHDVVSIRDGVPIVSQPDGQMLQMQPNGRLGATLGVERVQSYLHVHG